MDVAQLVKRRELQLASRVEDLQRRIDNESDVLKRLDLIQERLDVELELTTNANTTE